MNSIFNKILSLGLVICLGAICPLSAFCQSTSSQGTIDEIQAKDLEINEALDLIIEKTGITIIKDEPISGRVSMFLHNVDLRDALRIMLEENRLAYQEEQEPELAGAGIFHVMTAEAFLSKTGYPFGQEKLMRRIPLRYIQGQAVLDTLEQMKGPQGRIVYDEQSNSIVLLDREDFIEELESFLKEMDVPVKTQTFDLQYRPAQEIAQQLTGVLTPGSGRLEVDPQANRLVITDTSLKITEIEKFLKQSDQQQKEFFVNTKVIQIVLNDEHVDGVDWEAIISDYEKLSFGAFANENGTFQTTQLSFGTISQEDYTILLEALDTVGILHEVSSESFSVDQGTASTLHLSSLSLSLSDEGIDIEDLMGKEEIKLDLNFAFMIENNIHLSLHPEFLPSHRKNVREDPPPAQRNDIIVNVKNGSVVVIGGIFKDVSVELTRKIPLLGDLPFVGFAFRGEGKQTQKTETVVFITPTVVNKE
jgi:type II secretory pathway component GspD/PulD (secretin)